MNSERATAYGRVVATIEEIGATKLQPHEIQSLRMAADTLLFSDDLETPGVRDALEQVEALTDNLAASGRWSAEKAQQLFDDLAECGPLTPARR